jgi:hypothetical protein
MGQGFRTALVAGVAAIGGAAGAQPAQKVTGPVATYWMSAQTQTGFGMPTGGARPSMASMMGAAMGRGGSAQHALTLQLGSSRSPQGEPEAEHLPPPGLGAGASLPLLTPRAQPAPAENPEAPREWQQPKGRMLIFWGCGEHAGAGQPLVIDFAQVQGGKMPASFQAMSRGLNLTPMRPPAPGRTTTYGEWPNERTQSAPAPDGSLVGDHVVRGDYTPEIRFALNPSQDFLAPLSLTTNAKRPTGSVQLGWGAVPNARAYLATAMGGGQQDTVVLWTSSEVQASAFALPDYISPSDLTRLVSSRALMSPQTTACVVPKEVVDAAPAAMVQLVAYGDEANFVYPPRPSDPKVAWNKEWQVKVRYRSATGGLLGTSMGDMDQASSEDRSPLPQKPQSRGDRARSIMRGLGGAVGVPVP